MKRPAPKGAGLAFCSSVAQREQQELTAQQPPSGQHSLAAFTVDERPLTAHRRRARRPQRRRGRRSGVNFSSDKYGFDFGLRCVTLRPINARGRNSRLVGALNPPDRFGANPGGSGLHEGNVRGDRRRCPAATETARQAALAIRLGLVLRRGLRALGVRAAMGSRRLARGRSGRRKKEHRRRQDRQNRNDCCQKRLHPLSL